MTTTHPRIKARGGRLVRRIKLTPAQAARRKARSARETRIVLICLGFFSAILTGALTYGLTHRAPSPVAAVETPTTAEAVVDAYQPAIVGGSEWTPIPDEEMPKASNDPEIAKIAEEILETPDLFANLPEAEQQRIEEERADRQMAILQDLVEQDVNEQDAQFAQAQVGRKQAQR